MTDQNGLNALRVEIDSIDDQIHALLQRRVEIVEGVARSKGLDGTTPGTQAIRTGREADIINRLLAKTSGGLRPVLVARIWREIIASSTGLQGPMAVAVGAPNKSVGYWDLARDHFGSSMPMTLYPNTEQALQKARAKSGTLAVLPLPGWKDPWPWWPGMCSKAGKGLKVIAKLPVVEDSEDRFEKRKALVLAEADIDDSANDVTLLVLGAGVRQPPGDIKAWLEKAGLDGVLEAVAPGTSDSAPWLHLIALSGHHTPDSTQIDSLKAHSGDVIQLSQVIGGYITPYHVD